MRTANAAANITRAGSVYLAARPSDKMMGSFEPPVSKLASNIKYEAMKAARIERRSAVLTCAPLRRANIISKP